MRELDLLYTVADQDYYLPLHRACNAGSAYEPDGAPADWMRATTGVWTTWMPPGGASARQGWKVHVSARFGRACGVLNTVAGICFDERVPFKHLSASLYFLVLQHKHASRVQSGKFFTAYPPDIPAARRLMERLSAALRDEDGPYILTDRRYGRSRTVHYRYGAFDRRSLLRADGTRMPLVKDGHGRLVEDRRLPAFTLPEGITDPFCATGQPAGPAEPAAAGPVTVGGYLFDGLLRYSNAGGSYRGSSAVTGREVFIKEARAHNGLFWDGSSAQDRMRREHATLRTVHEQSPGLCPEPLDYFREWEHEFLVTEFVPGMALTAWVATHNPFIQATGDGARYRAYYRRCLQILDALAEALTRLHRAGYAFIDVNPGNVLLDQADHPRLVDFEAASPLDGELRVMGAPGFLPPDWDPAGDAGHPAALDEYGLSAMALYLLAPLHQPVQRCPDTLRHLRRDLDEFAPVPERLWRLVTRLAPTGAPDAATLCSPAEVAAEPRARLAELRDSVADGLLAMADHDDPDALFPTVPLGHATNTLCLAYGTAGVLHALHTAGRELPGRIVGRFRADALRRRAELPPGLHNGNAGIAWVLGSLGLAEEAEAVLAAAGDSPLIRTGACATLGEGAAGLAMAHLALYHGTAGPGHLAAAVELAEAIPDEAALVPALGPDDAIGLLHGRAGIALFLHYLSRATGDTAYLDRGRRLLTAELARAIALPDGSLSFPDSAVARRAMPYLFTGSAGVLFTAARYPQGDAGPPETIPRIRRDVTKRVTALPGLYCGLAGLGFALAEYGDLTGDDQAGTEALRIGAALFKYAVPGPAGVRFHGDRTHRFSADLWSGSAGVLVFLDRLLSGHRDTLFTFDAIPACPIDVPGASSWEMNGQREEVFDVRGSRTSAAG